MPKRSEQIAAWVRLQEAKRLQSSQVGTNETKRDDGRGHRQESGIRKAARDLGINKDKAQRAVKIAGISDEAKEAARERCHLWL